MGLRVWTSEIQNGQEFDEEHSMELLGFNVSWKCTSNGREEEGLSPYIGVLREDILRIKVMESACGAGELMPFIIV